MERKKNRDRLDHDILIEEITKDAEQRSKRIEKVRYAVESDSIRAVANQAMEKELWHKFISKYKGAQFITRNMCEDLCPDADVYFITTPKNVGKTTNIIFNHMKECIKNGKKFVFLRTGVQELNDCIPELELSDKCPVWFKKQKGRWVIFDKDTNVECGFAKDFKGCNAVGGGEFEGYWKILYDEALTWDSRCSIRKAHIDNLLALTSTIQRVKKEKIQVIFTSNIPTTGKNYLLLDCLGIGIEDKLRVIDRVNENNPSVKCKIFYLNTGDFFPGISDQDGAVQMSNQIAKELLNSNVIMSCAENTIAHNLFDKLETDFSFIKMMKSTIPNVATGQIVQRMFIFQLKKSAPVFPSTTPVIYALKASEFTPLIPLEGTIYTDSHFDYYTYQSYTTLIGDINDIIEVLVGYVKGGLIRYVNDLSRNVFREVYTEWEAQANVVGNKSKGGKK